jgi:hypothetical protein
VIQVGATVNPLKIRVNDSDREASAANDSPERRSRRANWDYSNPLVATSILRGTSRLS